MPFCRIRDGANCDGDRRSSGDEVLLRLLASFYALMRRLMRGLFRLGLMLLLLSTAACGRLAILRHPVVLYTSVSRPLMAEVEAAFESEHPSWDLQVIPADAAWLAAHRDDVLATFARLYGEG